MRKRLVDILLLMFLFHAVAQAQPEHMRFGHIRNDHGLSQNSGRAIKQDRDGYIWIATESGLNRYDGKNFEIFRFVPGGSNCLSNNYLNALETGRSKYVYIGTDGKGVDVYNIETGEMYNAGGDDSTLNEGAGFVYSLFERSDGSVYVGTGNGLYLLQPGSKKLTTVIPPLSEGNIAFRNICELSNGSVMAASGKGVYLLQGERLQPELVAGMPPGINCIAETGYMQILAATSSGIQAYKVSGGKAHPDYGYFFLYEFKGMRINHIATDMATGMVWVASDDRGLFAVSLKEKNIQNYRPELRLPQSLTSDKIKTLFIDQAGVLWIGTYFEGVHFLNTRRKKFYPVILKSGDNFLTGITGVTSDTSGNLWMGSLNGVYKYSLTSKEILHFKEDTKGKSGPVNSFVTSLFTDSRGNIWIGTDGGLSLFSSGKYSCFLPDETKAGSIKGYSVWGFSEDVKGRIWIATWDGGLSFYDYEKEEFSSYLPENSGISVRNINAVVCDKNDRVWAGTWERGLDMLDLKTGKWTNMSYNQSDSSSISHNIILSLHCDKNGNIWAGTFGGGLNCIDANALKIKRITQTQGLADNSVQGIKEDRNGNIWAFTMRGISRINPVTGEIRNYDAGDGLQGNEFSQNGSCLCKNGFLLASGPGGINYFDPDSIFESYYTPPLYVSALTINNRHVNPYDTLMLKKRLADADTLWLSWKQNSFTISFTALHFAQPLRIQYACKLEGFDDDWVFLGNNPLTRYTSIPPGTYTLLYRATNCDGIWAGTPKKLTIIIHPPFWSTWWFITLISVFSAALIIFVVIIRERTLKSRNRNLEKKVEERTSEINQQKEEILAQRDEIEAQRDMVVRQHQEISHMHNELTSSIRYALRIQEAMLPGLEILKESGFDHFLIFRPRDIVSGDFYWVARMENLLVVAVADCTGHGVPGAFMSMLGIAFLKEIVQKEYMTQPAVILRRLRKEIVKSLKQREDPNQKDGMDISLCTINLETLELQFAGANNPLYIVKSAIGHWPLAVDQGIPEANSQQPMANSQLIELKGDKMPIGIHERMDNFTLHTHQLQKGDCIYLFSDGMADQFGGPAGKKFKYKALKETILSGAWQPADRQKRMIELNFDEWKGRLEQVDDVTLLGIIV
jgi:ligand-binding sensor domain-containing protein/serine phosphatase RsbU (regulator of sigma subunit)